MNDIDKIMYLFDWNRSPIEQQEGRRMAREVKCLKAFFQPSGPGYCKSVWDNCALIICEHTDEELIPYLDDMLLWLQDLNWPGALRISQRLKHFSHIQPLGMTIDEILPALLALEDEPWLMSLAALLDNPKLRNALSDDSVQTLSKYKM